MPNRIDPLPDPYNRKTDRTREPTRVESGRTISATQPQSRMCARVYINVAQSVVPVDFIEWDAVKFDNGGFFTASANTRLTIPGAGGSKASGMWQIHTHVYFDVSGRSCLVSLYKNGVIAQQARAGDAAPVTIDSFIFDLDPVVGDYYQVQVSFSGASPINLAGDSSGTLTYFEIVHLW